jgi:hypothetical protein
MRGISWLVEDLLASQEGCCSMELGTLSPSTASNSVDAAKRGRVACTYLEFRLADTLLHTNTCSIISVYNGYCRVRLGGKRALTGTGLWAGHRRIVSGLQTACFPTNCTCVLSQMRHTAARPSTTHRPQRIGQEKDIVLFWGPPTSCLMDTSAAFLKE